MSTELQYKITFNTDLSGARMAAAALKRVGAQTGGMQYDFNAVEQSARGAGGALDAMASRSGYMRQAFNGVALAAQGDTTAIFGVAQAVRALWTAFTAGNPIILAITLAITAAVKAFQYFREKAKENAEALQKMATNMKEFTDAADAIRDKQNAASLSTEAQSKRLEKVTKQYDEATASAEKYAEAQKKVNAANAAAREAGIEKKEAGGLLKAGNDQAKIDQVKLWAEQQRKALEAETKKADLAIEQQALFRKEAATKTAIRDLTPQVKFSPEFILNTEKVNAQIEKLYKRMEEAGPGTKEGLAINVKIREEQEKLGTLNKNEQDRLDKVNELLDARKKDLEFIALDLKNNETLQKVLETQGAAEALRLERQQKINAEQQKELALKRQQKTLEENISAAKKKAADDLEKARLREKQAADAAAAAWKRTETPNQKTPQERIAEARKKAARGIRSPEIAALNDPDVLKHIAEGGDIDTEIARYGDVKRAADRQKRLQGNLGGKLSRKDILELNAGALQKAADLAKQNREAMEKKQADDIGQMAGDLKEIKSTLVQNLQLR